MKVAIVSTYPPRRCGIGTFSYDLRGALAAAAADFDVRVVAITREESDYGPEVVHVIRQDVPGDYVRAARALEADGTDVVLLQHEFGIFGGADGEHVLLLAGTLRVPFAVTLHTVLTAPSPEQARVLRELCERAAMVTVMTETGRRLSQESVLCLPERMRVVPHGAPEELRSWGGDRTAAKRWVAERMRLPWLAADPAGATVLSTFGLLSRSKGLETAVAALPTITAKHPEVHYVIAGQTHPEVARRHGEEYRVRLERQVDELRLTGSVHFVDHFLDTTELSGLLAATDVYLTPYRSKEQIVSGALTFAVVAGCPVVSTPYHYAEDLLRGGAGRLVGFDDPDHLAAEVLGLLDDRAALDAARAAAWAVGATMTWPAVGREVAQILREAAAQRVTSPGAPRLGDGTPRLDHLRALLDDTGVVQHAEGTVPLRGSGYCVDDMARLGLVALALCRAEPGKGHERMLATALGFLRHAWDADAAAMHNLMGYDRRWLDEPHLGDHLGRAVWTVGEALGHDLPPGLQHAAHELLTDLVPALARLTAPRSIAYALLGLARPPALPHGAGALLRLLAARLAETYRQARREDWPWFEDRLTYDNARLPQALLLAGHRLQDDGMVARAVEALDWYWRLCARDDLVHLVGNEWLHRGQAPPGAGDEQPLDAAALVEAHVDAYTVTGQPRRAQDAARAFAWFLGRNQLGVALYEAATGACHDGLGPQGVNLNCGAESTLAYLQAALALAEAGIGGRPPR